MPCAGVIVNQMHPGVGPKTGYPFHFVRYRTVDVSRPGPQHMQLIARLGVNHRRLLGLSQAEKTL